MQGGVEALQRDASVVAVSEGLLGGVLRGRGMLEVECVQVVVA